MTSRIVAVPGLAAEAVGALVYWSLSGPTKRSELAAAWRAAGLPDDQLPEDTSPETAACRAAMGLRDRHRRVVALQTPHTWAVVDEVVRGEDVDHDIICRVRLDHWIRVSPLGHELTDAVEASFQHHLDYLTPDDVSSWMIGHLRLLGATSLRRTGGFYFLPRWSYERWRRVVQAVRNSTNHTVSEIPAMRSDEAVDSVVRAVSDEADGAIEDIQRELREGDLGARALKGRAGRCTAALAKVQQYEELLGAKMETLRARVDSLHAELVAAALAAEAEEEAAR